MAKAKKASDMQKLFLIAFMERHINFANDRFGAVEGSYDKQRSWDKLAIKLNSLGGSTKTGQKWRKYWIDQKSHISDKEALLKIDCKKTNINKKRKELSDYEQRVIAITVPAITDGVREVAEGFPEKDHEVKYLIENSSDEFFMSHSKSQIKQLQPQPQQEKHDNQSEASTSQSNRKRHPVASGNLVDEQYLDIKKRKLDFEEKKFKAEEDFRLKYLYNQEMMLKIESQKLKLEEQKLEIEKLKYNLQ